MIEITQVTWFLCLLLLSIYHILIFRLSRIKVSQKTTTETRGVSVIIAVKNGTEQIKQHLDLILHQEYPIFEVIIVDDQSDKEERENLESFVSFWPKVKLLTSKGPGKKWALMTGIENAKHDFVLCTDADCSPAKPDWIKTMMEYTDGHQVVIGYSPYQKLKSWLNVLIRFETVMTGIQYLSWAMRGKPYMAVGRNILYPRLPFMSVAPFTKHHDIPYGDDDLGLQAMSEKSEINVCVDEKAFVISTPATSWSQWLAQKHRHLSAAHYYKPGLWWQPGLFGVALIGHWVILGMMIDSLTWWKWIPIFAVGLFIRWVNYLRWTRTLGDRDTARWYPLLEIVYTVYLALMGTLTLFVKKRSWN